MNTRNKIALVALGVVLCGARAGLADSITGLNNTGGNGAYSRRLSGPQLYAGGCWRGASYFYC